MRLRLLAAGVWVASGACDAGSAAPWSADPVDIADAAAGSPENARVDAGLVDARLFVDARPLADAAPSVAPVPLADAAQVADAAELGDARASWPLGMNDVTILTPLPAGISSPVLMRGADLGRDGAPLVPWDLYEQAGGGPCFSGSSSATCVGEMNAFAERDYERLHLVAVRFDLCDRNLPATCREGEDGRLRLVWQPLRGERVFADASVHAFFAIPSAELGAALAALRELAELQGAPIASALAVSPGLSDPNKPQYAEGLRAFVRAYAQRARLVRFTVNAQPAQSADIRWLLRGLERQADGTFREIVIPGSAEVRQDVFARGDSFEARPSVDLPAGLAGVLSAAAFSAASREEETVMLEALLAVDHPLRVAPDTAPCVACHTSTSMFDLRTAGVPAPHLRGGYVSSQNVAIDAGKLPVRGRTLRALGYLADTPIISRRVAHETAQVLSEIEQRFP